MQDAAQLMSDPFIWKSLVGLIGAGWMLDRISTFINKTREPKVDDNNGNARKRIEDMCRSMETVAGGLSELSIHFKYSQKVQDRTVQLLEGIHAGQSTRNSEEITRNQKIDELIASVVNCDLRRQA